MDSDAPVGVSGQRSRRLRFGCVTLGLFVLLCSGTWLTWRATRGWTSARVERQIQEEVPPGCGRSEVQAWFDRHGIVHGYFEGTAGTSSFNIDLGLRLDLHPDNVGGVEQGFIPTTGANEHLILPSEILIYFIFDNQGRLAGHLVDAMVYGP